MAITKTNAMRRLDAAKIPYRVMEYVVDENDLSAFLMVKEILYERITDHVCVRTILCFRQLCKRRVQHQNARCVCTGFVKNFTNREQHN